jgi:hypothetical protein
MGIQVRAGRERGPSPVSVTTETVYCYVVVLQGDFALLVLAAFQPNFL